jgi:hypothetical protein
MSPQTAEDTDSTHIQMQADRMRRGAGAAGAAQAEKVDGWRRRRAAAGGGGRRRAAAEVQCVRVLNESQGKKKRWETGIQTLGGEDCGVKLK